LAVFVLASAIAVPALAQQTTSEEPQSTPPVATQQQTPAALQDSKEGFWGRVNPFARKKWVNKRIDPLKDRLSELDEVNAKNARDIQDVDGRAQAGIRKAQSTADGANQTASMAGDQAQKAGLTAQGAAGHVDRLNTTVDGLDQYHEINALEVQFRAGQPVVSAAARKQLDELAASLAGHQGYILEIEGHSRLAGSAGIQSSQRLNEAVKRYLVTTHQIPVYRLHSVALGNAKAPDQENVKMAKNNSVQIRLMENSLAAQGAASPHDASSLSGAERP
jgi:outer membrane protein OmpA-like peptidoglycan-associated protein